MMMFRKLIGGSVILLLGLSLLAFSACRPEDDPVTAESTLMPGTWISTTLGARGPEYIVIVTTHDKGIFEITHTYTEAYDPDGYDQMAISVMIDRIMRNQTVEVDTVAGSSFTCNNFKGAVRDALIQAGAVPGKSKFLLPPK
jgi:uncharacterized protein with FMN-binding domain